MDNKREEGFNLKKPKLTKEMNKIIKIVDWLDQHQLKSKCFTDISERGEASELSKVEISKNKNISVKRKKI